MQHSYVASNSQPGRATTGGCPYKSESPLRSLRLTFPIRIFSVISVPSVVKSLLLYPGARPKVC